MIYLLEYTKLVHEKVLTFEISACDATINFLVKKVCSMYSVWYMGKHIHRQ